MKNDFVGPNLHRVEIRSISITITIYPLSQNQSMIPIDNLIQLVK